MPLFNLYLLSSRQVNSILILSNVHSSRLYYINRKFSINITSRYDFNNNKKRAGLLSFADQLSY